MAILVILVLGVLWAAVLVPPILRSRNESGAPGGVGDFLGRLKSGLGHGGGRNDGGLPPLQPIMGPMGGPVPGGPMMGGPMGPAGPGARPMVAGGPMNPQQRRRQNVLIGLLGAAGLTFLLAVMGGKMMFWGLHLACDVALGGFVYMLLQLKAKRSAERPASAHSQARQPMMPPAPAPYLPPTNVAHLSAHRPPSAVVMPAHVEAAPREATILALRRTANSW